METIFAIYLWVSLKTLYFADRQECEIARTAIIETGMMEKGVTPCFKTLYIPTADKLVPLTDLEVH